MCFYCSCILFPLDCNSRNNNVFNFRGQDLQFDFRLFFFARVGFIAKLLHALSLSCCRRSLVQCRRRPTSVPDPFTFVRGHCNDFACQCLYSLLVHKAPDWFLLNCYFEEPYYFVDRISLFIWCTNLAWCKVESRPGCSSCCLKDVLVVAPVQFPGL